MVALTGARQDARGTNSTRRGFECLSLGIVIHGQAKGGEALNLIPPERD
jgi:hypothetical protein